MKFLKLILLGLLTIQCLGYSQEKEAYNTIKGMATQEILDMSNELYEINSDIYKRKTNEPQKTTYWLVDAQDNLGWSLAIVDIDKIIPHFHRYTLETIKVVTGVLEVTIDNESHILQVGDVIVIPTNAIHSAKSIGGAARALVSCLPALTSDDQIFIDESIDDSMSNG